MEQTSKEIANKLKEVYTVYTLKDRLALFIKSKNLSLRKFASLLDTTSHTTITRIVNGSEMTTKTLREIHKTFPYLNLEWLITGEGYMDNSMNDGDLIDEYGSLAHETSQEIISRKNNVSHENIQDFEIYKQAISDKQLIIDLLQNEIERLKG